MRALALRGGRAAVVDRPDPEPREGEALVRVRLAGVCRTDLELVKGYMGFEGVLGHEFVGRVTDGPEGWTGARVVGEINFACGRCETCRGGLRRHCPDRRVMGIQAADGAMAELVAVPVANLHRVPESLADEEAVFAEPLAAAFEILEQLDVDGRSCAVLGDGKLGLLVAQVLHAAGARVLALGRHEAKLSLLRRRGIETRLAADAPGASHARFDVVVEATGREEGFRRAVALTRPRGTLVLKSTLAESGRIALAPVVIDEITVLGSRCGPFPPALEALDAGRVQVRPLVAARVPLARADEALRRAAEPGALKVLVDCTRPQARRRRARSEVARA